MPYDELLKWIDFFKTKRPIGWREDQRTFMIMAAFGAKGKPDKYFPTLKIMSERADDAQRQMLPKGKWLDLMLKAKDGDHQWKPFWGDKK